MTVSCIIVFACGLSVIARTWWSVTHWRKSKGTTVLSIRAPVIVNRVLGGSSTEFSVFRATSLNHCQSEAAAGLFPLQAGKSGDSLDRCGHLQPEGWWRSGRCQGCVACTGEDAACAGLPTLNGQCHRCPGHPCGNSIKRVASPSAGIYWHVIIMLLFVPNMPARRLSIICP